MVCWLLVTACWQTNFLLFNLSAMSFLHPFRSNLGDGSAPVVTVELSGSPEPIGEALSDLKKEGYEADLNFEEDPYGLYCSDLDMRLNPESYHVDEAIRVEDEKCPDEKVVVYAVTYSSGVKGTVVDEHESPSGD